ncbi:unnamed protein product [Prorocentrum cordatum]|uniref:Uncharacterized protein n=1 Tax=Prorocentrum cordatum TaxID=2364126 RepID=A0ABN9P954_9DINO|nr:unnamed protein product [Polarella glacialis]
MPSWFNEGIKRKADGEEEGELEGKDKKGKGGSGGGSGSSSGLEKKVDTVIRLVLTNSREIADLGASVFLRYLLAVSTPLVAAILAAGKDYDRKSQEMKEKAKGGEKVDFKNRPSPHVCILTAAVHYGATKAVQEGNMKARDEKNKELMNQFWTERFVNLDWREIGRACGHFRIKTHRKEEGAVQTCTLYMQFHTRDPIADVLCGLMEELVKVEKISLPVVPSQSALAKETGSPRSTTQPSEEGMTRSVDELSAPGREAENSPLLTPRSPAAASGRRQSHGSPALTPRSSVSLFEAAGSKDDLSVVPFLEFEKARPALGGAGGEPAAPAAGSADGGGGSAAGSPRPPGFSPASGGGSSVGEAAARGGGRRCSACRAACWQSPTVLEVVHRGAAVERPWDAAAPARGGADVGEQRCEGRVPLVSPMPEEAPAGPLGEAAAQHVRQQASRRCARATDVWRSTAAAAVQRIARGRPERRVVAAARAASSAASSRSPMQRTGPPPPPQEGPRTTGRSVLDVPRSWSTMATRWRTRAERRWSTRELIETNLTVYNQKHKAKACKYCKGEKHVPPDSRACRPPGPRHPGLGDSAQPLNLIGWPIGYDTEYDSNAKDIQEAQAEGAALAAGPAPTPRGAGAAQLWAPRMSEPTAPVRQDTPSGARRSGCGGVAGAARPREPPQHGKLPPRSTRSSKGSAHTEQVAELLAARGTFAVVGAEQRAAVGSRAPRGVDPMPQQARNGDLSGSAAALERPSPRHTGERGREAGRLAALARWAAEGSRAAEAADEAPPPPRLRAPADDIDKRQLDNLIDNNKDMTIDHLCDYVEANKDGKAPPPDSAAKQAATGSMTTVREGAETPVEEPQIGIRTGAMTADIRRDAANRLVDTISTIYHDKNAKFVRMRRRKIIKDSLTNAINPRAMHDQAHDPHLRDRHERDQIMNNLAGALPNNQGNQIRPPLAPCITTANQRVLTQCVMHPPRSIMAHPTTGDAQDATFPCHYNPSPLR